MTKTDLIELATKAIAEDDDHLTAPDDADMAWLIAQLACWPNRVDPSCTTNIRFLMVSAAAALREHHHTTLTPPARN